MAAILFCAGAAFLWESAAQAQQVTSLDKLPAAVSAFDDGQRHEPLPCSVQIVKPELNFGFRFQTGYTFETSLDPYLDGQHHWYIVFRVTPESNAGKPVYFLDSIDLPARHLTALIGGDSGTFQTGEGRFHVEWGLLDDLGRVCRQEWTIDAHLTFGERSEKVAMPPGTVGDFSSPSTESSGTLAKSRHVTILLNAGMPIPRRFGQPADSWEMLLSMLASIVEQMPEASFRVVVFDTEQQQEFFRRDDFTMKDMNDVARVVNGKQHWAVDYHALQDPAGGWHLLRDLENKEINTPSPADSVIFLGVQGRFDVRPPGMPGPKTTPRFFYLEYGHPPPIPGTNQLAGGRFIVDEVGAKVVTGAESRDPRGEYSLAPPAQRAAEKPDRVEQSVRRLKGRVFLISSPADFNKALVAIER